VVRSAAPSAAANEAVTPEHAVPRNMPTFRDRLSAPPFKRFYEPDSIRIMQLILPAAC